MIPFLKGVGFNPKTDIDIVPLSGYTGANLLDPLTSGICPWYTGPPLLSLLDDLKISDRHYDGALRIPITEKSKDMGVLVTGKIESGKIRKGMSVLVMPNRKLAVISEIYVEENEIPGALAGDNVRIRLKNVEDEVSLSIPFFRWDDPYSYSYSYSSNHSLVGILSVFFIRTYRLDSYSVTHRTLFMQFMPSKPAYKSLSTNLSSVLDGRQYFTLIPWWKVKDHRNIFSPDTSDFVWVHS